MFIVTNKNLKGKSVPTHTTKLAWATYIIKQNQRICTTPQHPKWLNRFGMNKRKEQIKQPVWVKYQQSDFDSIGHASSGSSTMQLGIHSKRTYRFSKSRKACKKKWIDNNWHQNEKFFFSKICWQKVHFKLKSNIMFCWKQIFKFEIAKCPNVSISYRSKNA